MARASAWHMLGLPWFLIATSCIPVARGADVSSAMASDMSASATAGPRLPFRLAGLLDDPNVALDGAAFDHALWLGAAAPFRIAASADARRSLDCLTAAIYHEARSESDAGQRAVAQVVLNRVRHAAFPATICGVVFEGSNRRTGCQFSFTCDGSLARARARADWNRAEAIAAEAMAGRVHAPVGLATHYHTRQVRPYWARTLTRVASVGAHIFYRWNGAAGEQGAFTQLARFDRAPAARQQTVEVRTASTAGVTIHAGIPAQVKGPTAEPAFEAETQDGLNAIAFPAALAAEAPIS